MPQNRHKRNIFLIVFGIFAAIVAGMLAPESHAQISFPEQETFLTDQSLPLPPIGPRETGFNPLDTPFLFRLGSTDKMKGEERERILQSQYHRILQNIHGEVPEVTIDTVSGMTVVTIADEPFATVLPADAPEYYERLSDERKKKLELMIAQRWKWLLQLDLTQEARTRSPESLAAFPYIVGIFFFISLVFHALADSFATKYLNSPGWSLKAFIWLGFLALASWSHPVFKPLATPIIKGGVLPIFYFLIIVTSCGIAYRLGCRALENYARAYMDSHRAPNKHLEQRIQTIIQGGRFLVATVVAICGFAWMMGALGVDVGKIFAGAGFAGVALGVIGKDILNDYFFGLNILAEDQFTIGDFIETPVATGTVESFNLRTTRIRETDGGLSIVTNSQLTLVKNHSRDFANADFRVGVAYGCDTDRCLELICDEVKKFAEECPGKLEPNPVFTGVHELGDNAVTLRALIRTAALEQWGVGRELNRRVLHRFEAEGIEIPFPQRTVWLRKEESESESNDRS